MRDKYSAWYFHLGPDADAAKAEEETRQLRIAELPCVDDTGEDG